MRGNRKTTFDALLIASVMALAAFAQSPPRKTPRPKSSRAPAVAEFQRDPIRLVEEFSLDEKTRHLAFDLSLAVEESLGPEVAARLTAKQRAALKAAFDRVVAGIWETWNADEPEPVRVLERDVKPDRAALTVLRGEDLLRLRLASRNGAWFITEHEILDEALAEFADAFAGVTRPGTSRAPIYEAPIESGPRMADALIAGQDEKPELLLMKYRLLDAQRFEQIVVKPDRELNPNQSDQLDQMLKHLTTSWPDFAPGRLARGRALLYSDDVDPGAISPLSQDADAAIAELTAYARLAPYDPRPHRDLAYAFEQQEKFPEAEAALRRAVELDPAYLNHHRALVVFHLIREEPEKARSGFARMLKAAPDPDAAFEELRMEYSVERPTEDDGIAIESLLLTFPKELEKSYAGWALLALAQSVQNKLPAAVKSLQRAMAIETNPPIPEDYAILSMLYRSQRRFPEALNAADQAIRLDAALTDAYLERACSLAQLGRKREALAALKQIRKIDPEGYFSPDEPDLQPLASLPEFKAVVERMKNSSATAPARQSDEMKPKGKAPKR
ncbi:MAG: tetratricopeptide repeat protein [Blastocatellia bacterium]